MRDRLIFVLYVYEKTTGACIDYCARYESKTSCAAVKKKVLKGIRASSIRSDYTYTIFFFFVKKNSTNSLRKFRKAKKPELTAAGTCMYKNACVM